MKSVHEKQDQDRNNRAGRYGFAVHDQIPDARIFPYPPIHSENIEEQDLAGNDHWKGIQKKIKVGTDCPLKSEKIAGVVGNRDEHQVEQYFKYSSSVSYLKENCRNPPGAFVIDDRFFRIDLDSGEIDPEKKDEQEVQDDNDDSRPGGKAVDQECHKARGDGKSVQDQDGFFFTESDGHQSVRRVIASPLGNPSSKQLPHDADKAGIQDWNKKDEYRD